MPASVTLETKCWERDWKKILRTDRLTQLAKRNRYPFAERVVMINNVTNYDRVVRHAEAAVERGLITKYVVVKDHAAAALEFFDIRPDSFGTGYVYSIAELVSIFICATDYLLHFASDCLPDDGYEWVPKAIAMFDTDPRIRVANLLWDATEHPANSPKCESTDETDEFYLGYGFSDQCYLVRTADFHTSIYNETNPTSDRYPKYGGNLFEKRVDSWMRNREYLRATYKFGSYRHEIPPPSLGSKFLQLRRRMRARLCNFLTLPDCRY